MCVKDAFYTHAQTRLQLKVRYKNNKTFDI